MPETSPGLLAKITGMRLRRQAGSDPPAQTPPGHTAIQGVEVWRETSSEEKEAILNVLPDSYFDPDFDALDHELSQAPLDVSAQALEAMAEERTTALEAVSEKLSHHIMRNYDAFAAGVQSVIAVEELVGSAKLRARISRERLAAASVDVQRGISVWQNTQRKRALSSLLEPLLNLRRAQELLTALRSALGRGNYREALRLCGRCLEVAEVLGPGINCSEGLLNAAGAALMDAIDQMRSVLSACATEFQPQQYHQVLQGYALLQEVDQFGVADEVHAGHDVRAAYAAAPAAAARKVVRGVLMARAGLEEKAARAQTLAELVDMLPSDLFRTCLARILMVAFDILEAYHQLEAWHRQPQHGSMKHDSKAGDGLDNGSRRGQLANGGSGSSGSRTEGEVSTVQQHETTAVESTASNSTSPRDEGCGSCYDSYSLQAVIDAVAEGLPGGRRLLWDEVSRAVSVLLGSPAAVDGEHFLQVLAWTQRLAAVGEAFSGAEAVPLRAVLNRQAGAFFRAFHQSNLEALNSMLEKEMWRRLPVDLPPLCDLGSGGEEGASAGRGSLGSGELAYQAFEDIVAAGNPWRRQKGSPRKQGWHQPRLGFSGPTVLEDDHTSGGALDVDERGFPRTPSNRRPTSSDEADLPVPPESNGTPGTAGSTTVRAAGGLHPVAEHPLQQAEGEAGAAEGRASGAAGAAGAALTTASWRMARWWGDYADLMRTLPAIATSIFTGMTELFDLYLLHVYLDFADPGTAGAVGSSVGGHSTSPGASAPGALHAAADVDGLSPRLRAILQHVIVGSIGKHRALLVNNKPGSKLSRVLAAPTAKSTSAGGGEGGGAARSGANGPGAQPHASPGVNGLTHSGNLYGVVERFAAADSLLTAARHLAAAVPLLEAALPVGDATAAAAFAERAVGAAEDLRGVVLARGCRLMLPLGWVPEAVAAGAYQANEPPSIAAQWTQQLGRQLELFAAQIEGVEELPEGAPAELWTHAAHAVATAVVEGLSKVRRCTLEGRAAMSLDLQALAHALGRVHPAGSGAETGALRLVDDYIKAFYVSLDDLPAWAAVHRQYSSKHVLALAACIAESKGLRRRELAAAVAKVEAALEAAALL